MPLEPGTEEGSLNRVTGKAHWGFGLALPSLHRRILRTRGEYQEVIAVTEAPPSNPVRHFQRGHGAGKEE